jgi:hypothetical protein
VGSARSGRARGLNLAIAQVDGSGGRFDDDLCVNVEGDTMFDNVRSGASDFAASKVFFLKALEPLGVVAVTEGPPS